MTPEQSQAIVARESAWIDSDQFAPLDLSQFPGLQPLPPTTSRDDGRFAKDWRDTPLSASGNALRSFVANPDTESLERVGTEIGQTDFRDEVRQRRGESVAEAFKRACPDYLPTDSNYRLVARTLAFNSLSASDQEGDLSEVIARVIDSGHWTVQNLIACFQALRAEGQLDVPAGTARELSERERLHVTRLAQVRKNRGGDQRVPGVRAGRGAEL